VPDGLDPYPKSKTLAERAAWDFVAGPEGRGVELATVEPGLVLGPLLHARANVSVEIIRLLLTRAMPAVPRLGFTVVDARDVAALHRLAMTTPAAAGNRYVAGGQPRWLGEIAAVVAREYGPRGYRVPTRAMPGRLLRAAARVDRRLRSGLPLLDVPALVSSAKAEGELGWTARPADEAILAAAESLVSFGLVPRPRRGGG